MALIDLHCHLDLYDDPDRVAKEAVRRNTFVFSVTTTPSAFLGTAALAPADSCICTGLGLHPELAADREHELELFESLLPRTKYVGEVGLDASRQHRSSLDRQAGILMDILLMCARYGGRTISLHSRNASSLILDLLDAEPMAGLPILHWFLGTEKEISRAAEMGCLFSIGTSMLMSERGRRAARFMPRDLIVPETDGPFGAVSGRTAYPWDALDVATALSDIWQEDVADVRQQLLCNFEQHLDTKKFVVSAAMP